MYQKILNPLNGQWQSVNSKRGKKIIYNYLKALMTGGTPQQRGYCSHAMSFGDCTKFHRNHCHKYFPNMICHESRNIHTTPGQNMPQKQANTFGPGHGQGYSNVPGQGSRAQVAHRADAWGGPGYGYGN